MSEDEGYKDFLRKTPRRKAGKEYEDFLNREGDEKKEREDVLGPGVIKPRHLSEKAGHAEWDNHDPEDGDDPLDCAAPSEIVGVQASGEGSAHELARADHDHQIQHGIADNHLVTIDHAAVEDNDYAKFTANGLEGRSYPETLGDIGGASKTTAAWSKSIGSGGDYATWAAMIAAMPDLIAHAVTVTIKTGTTLTEICNLKNKHGLTEDAAITIQAEDYFPQAGAIPTATGATVTTLVDAGQAWAIDRFIDCWVFVVHGTGTDNGFVKITDSDATSVTVAAWPGTQPDNTSRYIIVGALIDGEGTRAFCFDVRNDSLYLYFYGIGVKDADSRGIILYNVAEARLSYNGIHGCDFSGIDVRQTYLNLRYSGIVGNNTDNSIVYGGVRILGNPYSLIRDCGLSDNNRRGIYVSYGGIVAVGGNFGDNNGNWGTYCQYSGQAKITGVECSGAAGNHSDPGTAGNANADQAAAY